MKFLAILALSFTVICATGKMVYMAEIFRHGARYPTHDIYDGKETKPFHGQLTGVGMRQQYLLGSFLRKDYLQQLGLSPQFNGRQVEVVSDSTPRCIESAYAHLAGWFPLGSGPSIPEGLDPSFLEPPFEQSTLSKQDSLSEPAQTQGHQSVPVKINSYYFSGCKKQTQIFEKRAQVILPDVLAFETEQQAFMLRMKGVFNLTLEQANLGSMTELYDTVDCDHNLGRAMPHNFTDKEFQELKFIQNYLFVLVYGGHPAKVFSTPVAKQILEKMDRIISSQQTRKLTVFSGHDSTVAPLLVFLNLTSHECVRKKFKNETVHGNCAQPVPFASSIQFELHQKDSQPNEELELTDLSSYLVKIRYNGQYYDLCGSNSKECSYSTFASRVRAHLVDYNKECGLQ